MKGQRHSLGQAQSLNDVATRPRRRGVRNIPERRLPDYEQRMTMNGVEYEPITLREYFEREDKNAHKILRFFNDKWWKPVGWNL